MTEFDLRWYNKDGTLAGEKCFPVTEDEVRNAFGIKPDEYIGDCLAVTPHLGIWCFVEKLAKVEVQLGVYDYFVEVSRYDTGSP